VSRDVGCAPWRLLAVNGGSSTIKFAVYSADSRLRRSFQGKLDFAGEDPTVTWRTGEGPFHEERITVTGKRPSRVLVEWLKTREEFASVEAIGHRVVHGMDRRDPVRVTPEILGDLRSSTPFAPDHLPAEIELIEAFAAANATMPQVACFDTSFHCDLPVVARTLPIPRRYKARGVRRYGFHGLSYAYLVEELGRLAGPEAADGRVVLAHLGSGASMAAVKRGATVDTTMAFTPAAGLVMSTRTGDIDPGLVSFFARTEKMTAQDFHEMVHRRSGLLGISETSSDMRVLLAREAVDARAAEAVSLFCYQARKWIGAFAAALGGLDTLVFSAGIGEKSAAIRTRICEGLDFLGIELDAARNAGNAPMVSTDGGRVAVRVIPTDEELMIARGVVRVLVVDRPSH
jgi:acetate kinase